jgi:hypothetical protein
MPRHGLRTFRAEPEFCADTPKIIVVFCAPNAQKTTKKLRQGPRTVKQNPFVLRLLKTVQMQGGTTHPLDGYPGAE